MDQELKYYYDGSNVLAEYDPSDNLSRRYIHGTNRIDERGILLEGEGDELDTFYYMLQELDTVTGLITKNGTLAEAYTYDAYGQVQPWGYGAGDFNRDGDKYNDDADFYDAYPSSPASDPMADFNMDGDVDYYDEMARPHFDPPGPDPVLRPPYTLFTSGIGNPYFFTGRRLHFLETLHDSPDPEDPEANWQIQYNRARHYHPVHGRWLQRDPSGYTDGMNLYEYVQSKTTRFRDPSGLEKWTCERVADWASPKQRLRIWSRLDDQWWLNSAGATKANSGSGQQGYVAGAAEEWQAVWARRYCQLYRCCNPNNKEVWLWGQGEAANWTATGQLSWSEWDVVAPALSLSYKNVSWLTITYDVLPVASQGDKNTVIKTAESRRPTLNPTGIKWSEPNPPTGYTWKRNVTCKCDKKKIPGKLKPKPIAYGTPGPEIP